MKRFLSVLLSTVMLMSTTAFAQQKNITVDDMVIPSVNIDGSDLLPVRSIAEAMGYTVEWNGETKTVALVKGPQYIMFTVGVDGYSFAKTAPQPLGAAPVIQDGVTYVPFELFTEVMQLDGTLTEDGFKVTTETGEVQEDIPVIVLPSEEPVEEAEKVEGATGVVTAVEENDVTINDYEKGEVILHINENCEITDSEGNKAALEDIKEGSAVNVVYGDAMTMSIPPQNNPVSVAVIQ